MAEIGEGEANDFRMRIGAMERRIADAESRVNVHEQKCAGRYQLIMLLLMGNILINVPAAWPHIAPFLGFMR